MKLTIRDFMPTERKCLALFRQMRWPEGIACPHCSSRQVVSNGHHLRTKHQRYRCKSCHRFFTDTTGTIFEKSQLQLREWFYIARELQRNRSMNQIAAELGRDYKIVLRAAHLILRNAFAQKFFGTLSGETEADELYHPAGEKGTKQTERPPRKRGLRSWGSGWENDKPPIVVFTERGGNAAISVVRHLTDNTIRMLGWMHLGDANRLDTDGWRGYASLEDMIHHESVIHSAGQYALYGVHNNTCEGINSLLRHWLNTFRGVCKRNLAYFVGLFEFTYNRRFLPPMERFTELLGALISYR